MTTVFVYIWNSGDDEGKPFGVFTSKEVAEFSLQSMADKILMPVESLKLDLYFYEVPLNKLFLADLNQIA